MLRATEVNTIYGLASGLNSVRHDGFIFPFQNYLFCPCLFSVQWFGTLYLTLESKSTKSVSLDLCVFF